MSLRETIELWKDGVEKAEKEQYAGALECFLAIPDPGARIHFNMANVYLEQGDLLQAEKRLTECLRKDPHMAIGYFQRGCLELLKKQYDKALEDFDQALKNLRGNLLIDYKQLGLVYKMYSCEVMYNKAYVFNKQGRTRECQSELDQALQLAAECSDKRHEVIRLALEQLRKRQEFLPYRLPKKSRLFTPPKSKTNVLQEQDFLGKAKVIASVVDRDSYTGFAGGQKRKEDMMRQHSSPVKSVSPPRESMSSSAEAVSSLRPPKPSGPPPTSRSSSVGGKPTSRSPSPQRSNNGLAMTIKIHYTTTRALRVPHAGLTYAKLLHMVCAKFETQDNSLTLWYKPSEQSELAEIQSDTELKKACKNLEEGYKLTLWAYEKETSANATILKRVVVISDYVSRHSDELSLRHGDTVDILKEVNEDWYHGECDGQVGILPKCYVQDL